MWAGWTPGVPGFTSMDDQQRTDGWSPPPEENQPQVLLDSQRDERFPPGFMFGNPNGNNVPYNKHLILETLYGKGMEVRQQTCTRGVTWHWSGNRGQEFLSRCDVPCQGVVRYFTHRRGRYEELRRDILGRGWSCFFSDYRGDNSWCKVRCVHTSGREVYYEGEFNRWRLCMIILPGGNIVYYEGEGDRTIKVRTYIARGKENQTDGVLIYDWVRCASGPQLSKRAIVRAELTDGRVRTMEGAPGEERIVKTTFPCGTVLEFNGPRGQEHMVLKRGPNGDVGQYIGPKGAERLHRLDRWNGDIWTYVGAKGHERVHTKILFSKDSPGDLDCITYTGPAGAECLKRHLCTQSGIVQVYTGKEPQPGEVCHRRLERSGELTSRSDEGAPWVRHRREGSSVPNAKRRRVMDAAQGLYAEVEALTEKVEVVKEGELVELGAHFKALREAVDKCVA